MNSETVRHRVLAGVTRSRLLTLLRAADGPMGVRQLADAVGLHPNSVREQLDQLVGAGLAVRDVASPAGRGRPAMRYAATDTATGVDDAPYHELAAVLAEELARRADGPQAAVGAGERWGRNVASGRPTPTDPGDARQQLVALLDDAGFAPEPLGLAADPIRLRRCPFGPLARERRDVVCGVHLGLMRGALRELDAPLDAVRLEP
ncbi:MAG TPA: helix-turn-helix domain-containing protein, partial [Candidatus Limnocylindria bacterium]